jgi:hypothetical protein
LPSRINSWISVAFCTAAALAFAVQCLLPNFIGIANNGDQTKVYAWFSLAPRPPETPFIYFQPDYVYAARKFWDSPFHSSETTLAWVATHLAGATHEGATFDIRWLGAIHATLFLAAFALLLRTWRALPPWALAASAIAPLLFFTDVFYTAYFNSFFMDAAAICGLLLMTSTAVWLATTRGAMPLCCFTAAALFFVTAKTQHCVWMSLPAAFLIAQGIRHKQRILATVAATLVLLAGTAMLISTDPGYPGQAMFNVVFYRLGPSGVDLRELGIHSSELRYIGTHSYSRGSPTESRGYSEQFASRIGIVRLLTWYARHPALTLHYIGLTLSDSAPEMRPFTLSNFPQSAGQPPAAHTTRWALWSNWRATCLRRWPWQMPAWYLLFISACLAGKSRLKWVALGVAALGAGEFFAASLGDALDAGRHLFLFDAATDITICFALGWAVTCVTQRYPATIRKTP